MVKGIRIVKPKSRKELYRITHKGKPLFLASNKREAEGIVKDLRSTKRFRRDKQGNILLKEDLEAMKKIKKKTFGQKLRRVQGFAAQRGQDIFDSFY